MAFIYFSVVENVSAVSSGFKLKIRATFVVCVCQFNAIYWILQQCLVVT